MAVKPRRPSGAKVLAISVMTVALLFSALPTAMLLAVGLAPTLVAFIVDMSPGRYLMRSVAGLNIAAVVPFLHKLWVGGHTMSLAVSIATDVYAWLVIYSAAAVGWLLFLGLPGAVAVFRQLSAKRRVYMLRERQKTLIAEWGDSILPAGEGKRGRGDAAAETDKPSQNKSSQKSAAEGAAEREMARRASVARGS